MSRLIKRTAIVRDDLTTLVDRITGDMTQLQAFCEKLPHDSTNNEVYEHLLSLVHDAEVSMADVMYWVDELLGEHSKRA